MSRIVRVGLLLLSLSYMPAWADSGQFSVGPTTAGVKLEDWGIPGLKTTILSSSFETSIQKYGSYTNVSVAASSHSFNSTSWTANFGAMSGSAGLPLGQGFGVGSDDVSVLESADTAYRFQNTTSKTIRLPVSESLYTSYATTNADWDGFGAAGFEDGLAVSTPAGSTSFDCSLPYGPGGSTGFITCLISTSTSTTMISGTNPFASESEYYLIPAHGSLDLSISAQSGASADGNHQGLAPEPGTLTLLGTALVGLAAMIRKRLATPAR
jgi:hypothetical protein